MSNLETKRKDDLVESRRSFLLTFAITLSGVFFRSLLKPRVAGAAANKSVKEVVVVEFSDSGKRLNRVLLPKIVKTEDEWRRQLPPDVFEITRHASTEVAYTGELWNRHEKGLYRCVCCGNALFSSKTKFDSGTGWPSFWAPIAPENTEARSDTSSEMIRVAVSCAECDAHLGHVFDDGPEPTHLRYCINSGSLRFIASSM